MQAGIQVEKLTHVDGFDEFARLAAADGFVFVERLLVQWRSGENRFDRPGEVLFGAFFEGQVVATMGLNWQREGVGRVRPVYVHPDFRRRGVARRLMEEVIAFGREHYGELILYTGTEEASLFYQSLGFQVIPLCEPDNATHCLRLR